MHRAGLAVVVGLTACSPRIAARSPAPEVAGVDVCARSPAFAAESSYFASVEVEDANSLDVPSNGDLWPSCSANGTLYTAWGDGFGFARERTGKRPDIGVATMRGAPWEPSSVEGKNLVLDRRETQSLFRVWTPGTYYQKPTGMLCRGGKIYLAVQDLNFDSYDDAPAATIAESSDGGLTWIEDGEPMFTRGVFTTVMFLDAGPDGKSDTGGYIYAYGLDFNFRGSATAPSPQGLYLARIAPAASPRARGAWEFFAGGADDARTIAWTKDIDARKPVLVDCTRRHSTERSPGQAVLGQGGVVYDAPLGRYIYTSWSEYTWEFYEAPAPWGPWRRFLSKDFGLPPWTAHKHGGYGTSAPSLYISADGKTLWVQSNTWSAGVDHNNMALRRVVLHPSAAGP